jgi:hypothetical protein
MIFQVVFIKCSMEWMMKFFSKNGNDIIYYCLARDALFDIGIQQNEILWHKSLLPHIFSLYK